MTRFHLPNTTHIGHVHLTVPNLERSLSFYRDLLGLQEMRREGATTYLAARPQGPALIVLTERPDARPRPDRSTGLYHTAIRLPNRLELARVFKRLIDHGWPFQGFSDHKVSEALYLADPDGNGLELYRDRPRDQWPVVNGQVAMRTDPLDAHALLDEAAADPRPWNGIHPQTDIGHVHLSVADLDQAEAFYCDLLGFDVTQRDYPGARFFAAGGYHHHIGSNIWSGAVAPSPDDAVGLRWFSVVLPAEEAQRSLLMRIRSAGVALREQERGWLVRDPFHIGVLLTTEAY